MGDDERDDLEEREARAAILRRRAFFVASAIAGLGVPAGCGDGRPGACLEMPPPVDVTLTPTVSASGSGPEDGGANDDVGATPAPSATASATTPSASGELIHVNPRPCLNVRPPPQPCLDMPPPPPTAPQVCLEFAPPKKP